RGRYRCTEDLAGEPAHLGGRGQAARPAAGESAAQHRALWQHHGGNAADPLSRVRRRWAHQAGNAGVLHGIGEWTALGRGALQNVMSLSNVGRASARLDGLKPVLHWFAIALFAATAVADSLPFLPEKHLAAIASEISGESAKRHLEGFSRNPRMRGSRRFPAASE